MSHCCWSFPVQTIDDNFQSEQTIYLVCICVWKQTGRIITKQFPRISISSKLFSNAIPVSAFQIERTRQHLFEVRSQSPRRPPVTWKKCVGVHFSFQCLPKKYNFVQNLNTRVCVCQPGNRWNQMKFVSLNYLFALHV